ncbi:MAG: O-antigen ligase family protein [Candidatus Moraniibacteriota bacterium]
MIAPLLLLAVLLLPVAHLKVTWFGLPLYLPEMAVFCAAVSFWFSPKRKEGVSLPDKGVLIGIGLFLLGALFSFLANPLSLTGLGMLKSWFFFPALFGYLVWFEMKEVSRRSKFLLVWFLVIAAVATRSLSFFVSGEMTYDGRLTGDFPSPNFLAFFLAPGIFIALSFFLNAIKEQKRWNEIFFGITLIVFFFALFLTHSYGVWFGVIVALLVFFFGRAFVNGTQKEWWIIGLIFFVALSLFGFDQGNEKWQTLIHQEERSSLSSRVMIWQAAVRIAGDHPVLGIGVGRFQEMYLAYQVYFPPYLEWAVPEPHNIFLALFLATGFVGLIGFLIFFRRMMLLLIQTVLVFGETKKQQDAVLMLSLWTLFLLYGLFDTPYFKNDLAYLFFLTVALSLPVKDTYSSIR